MYLLRALTMLEPGLSGIMLGSKCLGSALEYSLLHTREDLVRHEVARGVFALSLRETSQVCLPRRGSGVRRGGEEKELLVCCRRFVLLYSGFALVLCV